MNEVPSELGAFFENPGNAIDFSFEFTSGDKLSVVGITRQNEVVPAGAAPMDVQVSMIWKNARTETAKLAHYGLRGAITDREWCKKLTLALGRQSEQWKGIYETHRVLEYAVYEHDLAPISQDPKVYTQEEEQWVKAILGAIDSDDYKYIWDDESRRQEGRDYYEEWEGNTRERRGGYEIPWDRRGR